MAVSGTFTTTGQASPAIPVTKANIVIKNLTGTITLQREAEFGGTTEWVDVEAYTADRGDIVYEPAGEIVVRLYATLITSGTAKWSIGS